MTNLLIEEEQISMLGKMLYYSASHLTEREREIYDHLIENLMRKVNQLRTAERIKNAHSENAYSVTSAQHQQKRKALRSLNPEQVSRHFVDSWNKQDFETEFFCLASCFPHHKRKANTIQEYVMNRMQKYQERHTIGPVFKRVIEITSSQVHGNKASVYCIELHKMPDKDLTLHRQYEFIYEENSWKIADFDTLKSHESAPRHTAKT